MERIIRMAPFRIFAVVGALAFELSGASFAREYVVSSAADISRLASDSQSGDALVMRDGAWTDQNIVFKARGTAAKPVTLKAEHPGKVVLKGNSTLRIEGEFGLVTGIRFEQATSTSPAIVFLGRNCRLTESAVEGGAHKFFVRMHGVSNRVDHCYFAEKTNVDPTFQVEVEGQPNFHRIDHNHFGHRPPLGRNGGETLRVGYSFQSMTNSSTLVESNLFERCDGELEIISNKSCENLYRGNTFLDCAGTLTLRHGNRCVVEGNYFNAHGKKGSGGIRIIGEDHVVARNYIDGVAMGGFWITAGIPNSELKGYFQARNCVIAFNAYVNSPGPAIQLDAGMGTSRRTLRPENITISSNIFSITSGELLKGTAGANYKWEGNVAQGGSAKDLPGFRFAPVTIEHPPHALSASEVGPSWRH